MRFPVPGLPSRMCALSNILVGVVSLGTMLEKGVTWDTQDFFADDTTASDGQLTKQDVHWLVLNEGDFLMIPFGHTVWWSPLDKDTLERKKRDDFTTGKALAMWHLEADESELNQNDWAEVGSSAPRRIVIPKNEPLLPLLPLGLDIPKHEPPRSTTTHMYLHSPKHEPSRNRHMHMCSRIPKHEPSRRTTMQMDQDNLNT